MHVRRPAGWVLVGLLLAGCGNRERAELMMAMDALSANPAVSPAMTRAHAASVIASLDLSREQATALARWAKEDGAEVRRKLESRTAEIAALAPRLNAAADAMVRDRASTTEQRKSIAEQQLGQESRLFTGTDTGIDLNATIEAAAETLAPLAAELDDRQQCVVLGSWDEIGQRVAKLMTAAGDDVAGARADLLSQVAYQRGYGFMVDEQVTRAAKAVVDAVPTGLPEATGVEETTAALLRALPAFDAAEQRKNATLALAALLSLGPSAELLALVP